jgi:hypothetical protein
LAGMVVKKLSQMPVRGMKKTHGHKVENSCFNRAKVAQI